MHFWPNKSIARSSKQYNVNNLLANRPKGLSEEEWNEFVKEYKLNKKIVLDTVPKLSGAQKAILRAGRGDE
jgi:hypothetical protein